MPRLNLPQNNKNILVGSNLIISERDYADKVQNSLNVGRIWS